MKILVLINKLFFLTMFVMLFSSCGDRDLSKQVELFTGTEISVPTDMEARISGRDTILSIDPAIRMVVWYDSSECAGCRVRRLDEWNAIINYSRDSVTGFEPVFIFSPSKEGIRGLQAAMKVNDFTYPMYIDDRHLFTKANPGIPADIRFHVFLLDKNNRVTLVGNPLHNESLWSLYKSTIKTLIDNGGVMPDEKRGRM